MTASTQMKSSASPGDIVKATLILFDCVNVLKPINIEAFTLTS